MHKILYVYSSYICFESIEITEEEANAAIKKQGCDLYDLVNFALAFNEETISTINGCIYIVKQPEQKK